jgi:hypothetical protein
MVGINVFLLFLHDDRRIRILEAQKHVDPVDPDSDPQHWFIGAKFKYTAQRDGFG